MSYEARRRHAVERLVGKERAEKLLRGEAVTTEEGARVTIRGAPLTRWGSVVEWIDIFAVIAAVAFCGGLAVACFFGPIVFMIFYVATLVGRMTGVR